jgi:hypothetical protein
MKRCEIKLLRKTCVLCFERRARFRYRGRVKWDRQHSYCFRCFRSARDRARSVALAMDRETLSAAIPQVNPASSVGISLFTLLTLLPPVQDLSREVVLVS